MIWLILVCIIFYSGHYLFSLIREDKAGEAAYEKIRTSIKSEFTIQEKEEKRKKEQKAEEGKAGNTDNTLPTDNGKQTEHGAVDAQMWIQCEGTPIDYPVVQGKDNEYYLHHLPDGTPSSLGSIFIDAMNSPGLQDENTVLYGHHMNNGSMFASIDQYSSQSYYEQHPYLFLYTKEQDYRIDLFAGYVGGNTSSLPLIFATEEEFLGFIQTAKEKSTFTSDVQVQSGDKIVSLITCDYTFEDARYLLFGKLTAV